MTESKLGGHLIEAQLRAPARDYNAAHDLLTRNLSAARAARTAYIDDRGRYSFADLERASAAAAGALLASGVCPEQRILIALHDSFALPALFLGAIRAGIVPVLANTLLAEQDYVWMLADSRAQLAVASAALLERLAPAVSAARYCRQLLIADGVVPGYTAVDTWLGRATCYEDYAHTSSDDACFWLYSSGSTGLPKGTVHVHASLLQTAELYGIPILGIAQDDVVFSAAKLFFAYGLGNALSFPLAVGATTLLMAERPTPAAVCQRLVAARPTIFNGVPTLYASLLASAELPRREEVALRRCTSAGEALPADIGQRWAAHFGVDILDGIGSTEMLHIFLSNRVDRLRYGTSGTPVPGYAVRVVDEVGADVAPGEIGELHVAGPTAASMYWNNRAKSRTTFLGAWTRTGDKYRVDDDGYYVFCGRSDDMLKVGGIYVAPSEVEAALSSHPAVLEAAVVGRADEHELIKPAAYVVLVPGQAGGAELEHALQNHVKSLLAPYKYPRWVEFVTELPKTATGKIQRFKLRAGA